MDIDKQDLDEQIEHHQQMILRLRRRLRARELQEAEYGTNVPAEVTNEILALNERIAKHETELSRLRSVAAEGKVPLAEVEYRAALAQAWEPGRPTVAGQAHLEWVRVRSGIKLDRAEALEKEMRVALAKETIINLPSQTFRTLTHTSRFRLVANHTIYHLCFILPEIFDKEVGCLPALLRAVRQDIDTTVSVLRHQLQMRNVNIYIEDGLKPEITDRELFSSYLKRILLEAACLDVSDPDYVLIKRFVDTIARLLTIKIETTAATLTLSEEDEGKAPEV